MASPRDSTFLKVSTGDEDEGLGCGQEPIAPHLSRVLRLGTAKLVVSGGPDGLEENPGLSVVAQAQSEDFQEFSPTKTRCIYDRVQLLKTCRAVQSLVLSDSEDEREKLPHCGAQRKCRRKPRSPKKAVEPPIIRSLRVQEGDWLKSSSREMSSSYDIIPPPPQFTDSPSIECVCRESVCEESRTSHTLFPSEELCPTQNSEDSSCSDERLGSDPDPISTRESDSDFCCCAEDCRHAPHSRGDMSNVTFDLMNISESQLGSDPDSASKWGVVSLNNPPEDAPLYQTSRSPLTVTSDRVLDALRGRVTRMTRFFVAPFFKHLKAQKDWKSERVTNEGFVFHHQLEPNGCCYREEEEYHLLHHIQNGSYGDVFCVQDKTTGFRCAAKRIPLSRFSVEEVRTWSLLDSPRVVQLFGAVRDGLNVVLFMDLKPVCLGQILKEMKSLPEDLALHYLHQSLGALEHLHQKMVLHLDVKVDNVLLSADCKDAFLCDFGLSEMLDENHRSKQTFRGAALPGTETHMAPEVARGDRLSAKADVWSSCCMLLHMLNGYQPWISYYSPPLCLHIVNEPPPLGEVPSDCNNFTAQVFRSGLQKNPAKRASARELKRKTTKALRAVGGLSTLSIRTVCQKLYKGENPQVHPVAPEASSPAPRAGTFWVSPWRTTAVEEDSLDSSISDWDPMSECPTPGSEWDSQPKSLRDDHMLDWSSESEVDIYMAEEEDASGRWFRMDEDYEGDLEEDEDEEESPECPQYFRNLKELFPLLQKGQQRSQCGSEPELEYLRHDVEPRAKILTPSPEPRDDPPSCFSDTSPIDEDSDHSSDDLSSGVFSSCNSQSGAVSDNHLHWAGQVHQSSSYSSEGVDICIENIDGECLRIREHRQVKIGHVAIGVSGQISDKPFTLETLDRKTLSFEDQVDQSPAWLCCIPAPDQCQRWAWRVRDGRLELRE